MIVLVGCVYDPQEGKDVSVRMNGFKFIVLRDNERTVRILFALLLTEEISVIVAGNAKRVL